MKIEVLIIDGCPNVRVTVDRLKAVLRDYGLNLTITVINVGDEKTANELRFLGSPTVRIDGMDIERRHVNEPASESCAARMKAPVACPLKV